MTTFTSAILIAIGTMSVASAAQVRPVRPEPPPRAERPAPPAPPEPATLRAPAQPPRLALGDDDGRMHWTWSEGWRSLSVSSRGQIELTDDERDVKSVSPNGYFEISSRGWLSLFGQRYIVGGTDGAMTRRFSVGASERPIDAAARAWIGDTIQRLVHTGFAAEARVRRIIAQQGPVAVLDAISSLSSDYSKSKYFRLLLEQARLDRSTAELVLRRAGREISSDFELARVLTTFTQSNSLDDAMAPTFAEAAQRMGSDFERARVLRTVFATQRHTPAVVNAVLTSSSTIGSDVEKSRVFQDLAESNDLDAASVLGLVRAVGLIGSDFEKSRVLRQIIASQRLDAVGRQALLDVAGRIGSDHERGRVLSAMLQGGTFR